MSEAPYKKQMRAFILKLLGNSIRSDSAAEIDGITSGQRFVVTYYDGQTKSDQKIELYLHFDRPTVLQHESLLRHATAMDRAFLDIMPLDGIEYFVKHVKKGKHPDWKSVSRYREEIPNIVRAREIERKLLTQRGNPLIYYQPQTAQYPESLRVFKFQPVHLDYSHLDRTSDSGRHAVSGSSLIYFLPKEIALITLEDKIKVAKNEFNEPYFSKY